MISNIQYANAISEVLHYLKGIRQEDIDKIPKKILKTLNDNCSNEYICKFDYKKPLKELQLQEEAKGIIACICYNYWCETAEQKRIFLEQLNKNEINYQEELKEKYDIEKIFKQRKESKKEEIEEQIHMVEYKKNVFRNFWNKLRNMFRRL